MLEEEMRAGGITSVPLVDCPASFDVVFKPGSIVHAHPGNTQYRELLEQHLEAFQVQEKKQEVILSVINTVEQNGGRFLEWSPSMSCWSVVQDPQAVRTKVYSSFARMAKQLQAKRNLQVSTSSTFMFERQDGKKQKRDVPPGCCSKGCL